MAGLWGSTTVENMSLGDKQTAALLLSGQANVSQVSFQSPVIMILVEGDLGAFSNASVLLLMDVALL